MRVSGLMVAAAAVLFVVSACGGATGGQQTPASASDAAPSAASPASLAPTSAAETVPTSTDASIAPAGASSAIKVEAVDSAFNVKTIKAQANSAVTVTLTNTGEIPHDIAFYDKEGGAPLAKAAVSPLVQGGQSATFTFTTPGPGTYFFVCLVHPKEMTGTFVVE